MDFKDKNIRINSPISKRVLFILGLDENKLYDLTKEEYLENHPELKNFSSEIQDKKYEHFKFKREKVINDAKKLRQDLIRDIEKEKKKNKTELSYNDYFPYDNSEKVYSGIKQQIKKMVQNELNHQENIRNYIERQTEVEENLKKIKEEKEEKDELKKLEKENIIERVEKNLYDKKIQLKKKQEDIKEKEEEKLKRYELKKIDDLEELKRIAEENNEKRKKVYERSQLLYDKRRKKLLEKIKSPNLNLEKIEEVEPWKKEEEGERRKYKILLTNLHNELKLRKQMEENEDTEIKLLKMKEEKDALMKQKMKKITEKMKDKEERSLECMKRNAELEENKIKNIIEKSFQTEQKVKKQLNLKTLETKNKHLYLELLRKDNMENLKRIEKKKEYDREKIILKMMDKDRKLQEIQNQKKKNIDRIKSLNREMTAQKMILLKRAREMVQSGKYRNKKDIFEKVFNNENEVSSNWNYISQKQTLDY